MAVIVPEAENLLKKGGLRGRISTVGRRGAAIGDAEILKRKDNLTKLITIVTCIAFRVQAFLYRLASFWFWRSLHSWCWL